MLTSTSAAPQHIRAPRLAAAMWYNRRFWRGTNWRDLAYIEALHLRAGRFARLHRRLQTVWVLSPTRGVSVHLQIGDERRCV